MTARHLGIGPGVGQNTRAQVVLTNGLSVQSIELARTMALVTGTASPASIGGGGGRVWNGDPGYGVNRLGGALPDAPSGSPVAGAVTPVARPRGARVGSGSGAADPSGFPSTGYVTNGPVAMLDLGKLGNLGMKS